MKLFILIAGLAMAASLAEAGAPGSKLTQQRVALERSRRQQECNGDMTAACADKAAGATCSFTFGGGPKAGETITSTCVDGCCKPPAKGGGAPTGGGGGGGGGTPRSTSAHAAAMLGDVGYTTVAVAAGDARFSAAANTGTGGVGEDIFGPFEAGFSGGGAQKNNIAALGCSDPSKVELPGGVDTMVAEAIMGAACDMELPRTEDGKFISLLDQCGGHTKEYHNHERLICLYNVKADGHSAKVGEAADDKKTPIYGKYEATGVLPLLDACGGHFGVTPDSNGKSVYHYHVQDKAPFIVGCFGPNDDGSLVTVAQCRDFYTGCGDGDEVTFPLKDGKSVTYDLWCPCYDADGFNIAQKAVNDGSNSAAATLASASAILASVAAGVVAF